MIDVMFYEAFEEEERAIKKFLPGGIHAEFTWKTIQERGDKTPSAELISVRTQSHIPLDWAKSVKGVLTRSQGYDHLLAFRRESGAAVPCGYLENYCARAAAEQAVLMMMALLRKLRKQVTSFETFARDGLTGLECRGRKVFVAGVGRIGSEIVDIARGLRMGVKGFDIAPALEGIEYVSLAEGVAWADVVFCALPLTRETEGMLNYEVFRRAGRGKIFVNVGRGEISPAEDLKRLLEEGVLGGIGLDVYPQESVLAGCLRAGQKVKTSAGQTILELAKSDRALFTPHNAFNTIEALEQKASLSAASAVSFLTNGTFLHPVPAS